MPAADTAPRDAIERRPAWSRPAPGRAAGARWGWALAVALVLLAALALRLWGVTQGLPYAYNADENAHFVNGAMSLFGHGWDPHYFVNPPAYTYLLHLVFAVWFGGRKGVADTYATNPTEVFVVARVTAAVLGTAAVGLLYLAGARMFDRRVGLLAAGLLAVAFLPVFYSHLALNDVPTLAPAALSLWGTAGVLRVGRTRDYLIAGIGLGLACATKYTGGIMLLPLLCAAGIRIADRETRGPAIRGVVFAGMSAIAGFLVANPYALLDHRAFHEGLTHQAQAADDALGKVGLPHEAGWRYYLWTFTWGLGWVPLVAAVAGAAMLALWDRRALLVLGLAPVAYVIFMGHQERFFGRWLMPIFPIVCILGAYAMVRLVVLAARRVPALAPVLASLAVVLLCGQGLLYSIHAGRVLSRPDTRNTTRAWLVANVPARTKIVVEPVVPDAWATDIGRPYPGTSNGARWVKYPTSRSNIANDGSYIPGLGRVVNIEDYERTLFPGLVQRYAREGYCYVVSGSAQRAARRPTRRPCRVRSRTTASSSAAPIWSTSRARIAPVRSR